MTEADWFAALSIPELETAFDDTPDRKLHLLAGAFLRRVWDQLPSHTTRTAVEATEQFADRLITADQLAWLRSIDLLETCEGLWLGRDETWRDELLIGLGFSCCPICDQITAEYELRSLSKGRGLDGIRAAFEEPALIAAQAAFYAREIAAWVADPEERRAAEEHEAQAQYAVVCEILGPPGSPTRLDPDILRWDGGTVPALARGIHRTQNFGWLPILGDALEEAGCTNQTILTHCRGPGHHIRGCWVVDLAMGK